MSEKVTKVDSDNLEVETTVIQTVPRHRLQEELARINEEIRRTADRRTELLTKEQVLKGKLNVLDM